MFYAVVGVKKRQLSYIYKTESVRLCVSLFLMHDHSFEQICVKFGMWHPYSFWMVIGQLASARTASYLIFVTCRVRLIICTFLKTFIFIWACLKC